MQTSADIQRKIKKNQQTFLSMERKVQRTNDLILQCEYARRAAAFAYNHTTDIFSSHILEAPFIRLAQHYEVSLAEEYTPNTILHVMTMTSASGGHTRCVARWALHCPELLHSCCILNPTSEVPDDLRDAILKRGGEFVIYDPKESLLERALKLRAYASTFERVVLHIHMDDPIALIAFGSETFKRPIIFFNHADHAFWLGVSISDWVADITPYGNEITLTQRGVKHATLLGIPQEGKTICAVERDDARSKLGLPLEQKIIFSSGLSSKFAPLDFPSFEHIISDILKRDSKVLFYIVGPDAKGDFWPRLLQLYPQNVFLTGPLDYATGYLLYLAAADLVLDSFPVGGGTAMIDAVRLGKPALSLFAFQHDYILKSQAYCKTYEEFLLKAERVLNDGGYATAIYEELHRNFSQAMDCKLWHARSIGVIKNAGITHHIHSFERAPIRNLVSALSLTTCCWTEGCRKTAMIPLGRRLRRFFYHRQYKTFPPFMRIFGIKIIHYDYRRTILGAREL